MVMFGHFFLQHLENKKNDTKWHIQWQKGLTMSRRQWGSATAATLCILLIPSWQPAKLSSFTSLSRLTPQPPLPHAPPEDIPSLVGGVFHVLTEGSPQWSFYPRGLSHIPHTFNSYIFPLRKSSLLCRVSKPMWAAFAPSRLILRVCLT